MMPDSPSPDRAVSEETLKAACAAFGALEGTRLDTGSVVPPALSERVRAAIEAARRADPERARLLEERQVATQTARRLAEAIDRARAAEREVARLVERGEWLKKSSEREKVRRLLFEAIGQARHTTVRTAVLVDRILEGESFSEPTRLVEERDALKATASPILDEVVRLHRDCEDGLIDNFRGELVRRLATFGAGYEFKGYFELVEENRRLRRAAYAVEVNWSRTGILLSSRGEVWQALRELRAALSSQPSPEKEARG